MNAHLKLSPAGAALIHHFEGCLQKSGEKFKAYKCPAGVLTIGWGHTNHHGKKFDAATHWTQEQCDEAFAEDMEGFEASVRKLVKVPLLDHQYSALVSFAYNVGSGALGSSTLLRKLNSGDYVGASAEFPKWNKANGKTMAGLTRRRNSERVMFEGLLDEDFDGVADDPMPQAVDKPED